MRSQHRKATLLGNDKEVDPAVSICGPGFIILLGGEFTYAHEEGQWGGAKSGGEIGLFALAPDGLLQTEFLHPVAHLAGGQTNLPGGFVLNPVVAGQGA